MSEKKDHGDNGTPSPSRQPLPRVDGAEEVTETELDNITGGGHSCLLTVQDPVPL
jgi:bacteriocin-like protein